MAKINLSEEDLKLLSVEERPKRKIGFTAKEKRAAYTVRQKRK